MTSVDKTKTGRERPSFAGSWLPGAPEDSRLLRRRLMAALRMAHRVLGLKRNRLGLGALGRGAVAALPLLSLGGTVTFLGVAMTPGEALASCVSSMQPFDGAVHIIKFDYFGNVCIGDTAGAGGTNNVAIGAGAASGGGNSLALGSFSNDHGEANVIAVGNSGYFRTVKYVADGWISSASHDAVNGSQLYAVKQTADSAAIDIDTLGYSVANALGGGSWYDAGSNVVNAALYYNGGTYSTVQNVFNDIDYAINGGGGIKYFRTNSGLGDATAAGADSTAVGPLAYSGGANSIAMGHSASAGSTQDVALGAWAQANGGYSLAAGTNASANSGVALGSSASSTSGVAVGSNASASTGVAVGPSASASNGAALGVGAVTSSGVALGNGAVATTAGGVALGAGSVEGSAHGSTGATIAGAFYSYAGTTPSSVVSIGSAGAERQITNLAAGQVAATSTDAINGSQLFAVQQAVEDIAAATSGAATHYLAINDGGAVQGNYNNDGALGGNSVAFGPSATTSATAASSVAIGANASASNLGAVAIGAGSSSSGLKSIAIGMGAVATGSVAIGSNATASLGGTALGDNTVATTAGGVALGQNSVEGTATPTAGMTIVTTAYTFAGTAPTSVVSVGTAGSERQITNVAAGRVDAASTDAVNGSQLYAAAQAIETVDGKVDQAGTTMATILGGGATYDPATGAISDPTFVIQGGNYNTVSDAFDALDTTLTDTMELAGNTDKVAVKYDWTDANGDGLVDPGEVDYGKVTLAGDGAGNGTVISNVADGAVSATSTEAINGSQLFDVSQSVADALGGNSTVNPDGTITGPTYVVQGSNYTTVYDAFTAVDGELTNINNQLDTINNGGGIKYFHANSTLADSQATGTDSVAVGPAAVASATDAIAIGNGANAAGAGDVALGAGATANGATATTSMTIAGTSYTPAGTAPVGTVSVGAAGAERTITNVAAGQVTAASTDAVNGSQLYAAVQAIEAVDGKVDEVGQSVVNIIGGGSTYNTTTGEITNPTFNVQNNTYTTVGDAFDAVDDALTDAANTDQLAVKYEWTDSNADGKVDAGEVDYGTVTLAGDGAGGGTTVTNLAAGAVSATSTDAINGSQLHAVSQSIADALGGDSVVNNDGTVSTTYVISGDTYTNIGDVLTELDQRSFEAGNSVQYDTDANGARLNSITLQGGDANAPVLLSNVATGVADTDAVNVKQLNDGLAGAVSEANTYTDGRVTWAVDQSRTYTDQVATTTLNQANAYTDDKFNQLNAGLGEVRSEARQAAAVGLAAASLRYDDRPGKLSLAVGGGYWRNEGAFAFGAGYTSENGRMRANLSGATAGGEWGVGAGLSFTLN